MLESMRYQGAHRADQFAITRRLAGAATVVGIAMMATSLFGAPPAVGAHDGVIVSGNPKCEVGQFSYKDDDGPLSAASNGDVAITYSDDTHSTVTAADGFTINAVIIKAGSSAVVYSHEPYVDLPSIINNGGQTATISHVEVCYSTAATTTTGATTTMQVTTTTQATTTTGATTTTQATTTTGATTTTQATTTTSGPTTTSQATTTTLEVGATTTTSTVTPTTDGSVTNSTPPVSVLPNVVDQQLLPQTGIDDEWATVAGLALVVAGAAVLAGGEWRARSRRRALLRRL